MILHQGYRTQAKGFTMIETIIAFGVLTAAIIGPIALVAFSLSRAQASQNKLIATNLGQEGIELIRAIRENNVICDALSGHPPPIAVSWNANPDGGPKLGAGSHNYFTVDANDMTNVNGGASCGTIAVFPTPRPTETTYDACSNKLLNLHNGLYIYGSGTPTPFRRCVTICVPARSAPCNAPIDPDIDTPAHDGDQMEIISKVFWTELGRERSIQFQERLYNWR